MNDELTTWELAFMKIWQANYALNLMLRQYSLKFIELDLQQTIYTTNRNGSFVEK